LLPPERATSRPTRTARGGSPAEAGPRARGLTRAAEDAHLAAWRQAFSAFGAKPSKYPSSAEALATRVLKGEPRRRLACAFGSASMR
jgi:DNA/RNA-binding domain of Phe-tRNA-synthetase-like protein